MKLMIFKNRFNLWLVVFILIVQSCTFRIAPAYDENFSATVNQLQDEYVQIYISLIREINNPEVSYENYKETYKRIDALLYKLVLISEAYPNNDISKAHIKNLDEMFEKLEALHKMGFTDIAEIKVLEQPFNTSFVAIQKYQKALKNR